MTETEKTYSLHEEIANSISHGLGALLSVSALTLLVSSALSQQDALRVISFAIYGSCLLLLFISSTLYHALVNKEAKRLFKLLDHCAIYLLIAGTYTPLMIITVTNLAGYITLILIWVIALIGILFKQKFGHRYKTLSIATYIGMGGLFLPISNRLYQQLPSGGIILFSVGCLVYCLGVIFYVQKNIPFNHAIWHLFVLCAASCHFFMMWYYV